MFFKKFLNKFIYYLNIILIIPFLFINILRKTPYKFVRIRRDTIGNGASELYLYLNIFKKKNNHLYFFDDEYVCNNCLNLIYKKNFKFSKLGLLIYNISNHIKFFESFLLLMPNWTNLYKFNSKIRNFKTPSQYILSKNFISKNIQQQKIFNEFSKKINLNHKTKIACLIVRDSFYKKNFSNDKKKNWDYHNYRNAKIDTYKKSIKYLIKEGYKVIKLGKGSNQKLNIKNVNYFDYSSSKYRNDFIDFYLFSRASICITTGTGIDELATIYKIPTVDTNFFPISEIRSYQNKNITIFKKIWSKKLKRFLFHSELIENRIFFYPNLLKKELKFIDNTSEEIYQATKELNLEIKKKTLLNNEIKTNQKKFWDIYSKSFRSKKLYKRELLKKFAHTYKNRNIQGSMLSSYYINKNNWILK